MDDPNDSIPGTCALDSLDHYRRFQDACLSLLALAALVALGAMALPAVA